MSSVGSASSSPKQQVDPFEQAKATQSALPTPASKAPTEKKPAIDLSYVPPQTGPSNVAAFYAAQTQPKISPACAKAVDSGAPPAQVAEACTQKEFTIASGSAPKAGAVPVETDPACVKDYEEAGNEIGESVGQEAADTVKKLMPPVVRQFVAKKAKESILESSKLAAHKQGVADCKVASDANGFAAKHAPTSSVTTQANQTPAPSAAAPTDYTPADPANAVCK